MTSCTMLLRLWQPLLLLMLQMWLNQIMMLAAARVLAQTIFVSASLAQTLLIICVCGRADL